MFLLFPIGSRPDRYALHQLIHGLAAQETGQLHVSHDPGEFPGADGVESAWLEFLADGLTFDCLGLAPGPAVHFTEPRHQFGIELNAAEALEAVVLVPGPHLAGAGNSLPVVRTMVRIAAELAVHLPDMLGAVWEPGRTAIGKSYFIDVAQQWIKGGPFPGLGLTGIIVDDAEVMRSDGLAFFTGQEVEIEVKEQSKRIYTSQLLLRIMDKLVGQEKVKRNIQILGPDQEALTLAPSGDGSVVRVLMQ